MKHLNPRQGITTGRGRDRLGNNGKWCETPKSPPGDYNLNEARARLDLPQFVGVKHLNPRQGITTENNASSGVNALGSSVKHLNPRQGITTLLHQRASRRTSTVCV